MNNNCNLKVEFTFITEPVAIKYLRVLKKVLLFNKNLIPKRFNKSIQ